MFTMLTTINGAKFQFCSTIITEIGSFGQVIYMFIGNRLLAVYVCWRINNITKSANSVDNVARKMDFGLLDGGRVLS